MSQASAALILQKQLKELAKHPVEGFSAGLVDENIFEWDIFLMAPAETLYEGGMFRCRMSFPQNYPMAPPRLRFLTEIFHPNVFSDGRVCISILHPPGDDEWGYEQASERWNPVHTVESILISVISMLSDPNDESAANIEAGKMWRENREQFKKRVQRCVRRSQEML